MNTDKFYIYEVIEDFTDRLTCFYELDNVFSVGDRFIGWENENKAFKSNLSELIFIPLKNVKRVMKIEFKEV